MKGSTKSGFSVLATICANGDKLPLTILAKGKNEKILKKNYQDKNNSIIIIPSKSGWSDISTMKEFVVYLISMLNREKILIILDQYSAHKKLIEILKETHPDNKRLFIPAGCKGQLQPLDKQVSTQN